MGMLIALCSLGAYICQTMYHTASFSHTQLLLFHVHILLVLQTVASFSVRFQSLFLTMLVGIPDVILILYVMSNILLYAFRSRSVLRATLWYLYTCILPLVVLPQIALLVLIHPFLEKPWP